MSAGAVGAAAGAAARRRAQQKEEEQMTGYTPTDLADGWEFKILRSATSAFKKPDTLRSILDEEGRAGWVMLEKFDSQRVRLKRPAGAKAGDSALGFDPYRTTIGMSEGLLTLIIVGCVLATIAIVIGTIFLVIEALK